MNSKEVYKYRSQEDMYLFPIKAPRQERTGPTTTSCGLIVLDILVQCGTWIQTCSSFCSRRRRRVTRKLRALIIPSCFLFCLLLTVLFLMYRKSIQSVVQEEASELDDPALLKLIRDHHLTPPVARNVPYNLSVAYKSFGEHDKFDRILLGTVFKNQGSFREKGFFVEAGALDGQYLSHTLELEQKFGWRGLLVEASPSKVVELKSKKRKAWVADVCLTDKVYEKVPFMTKKNQSKHIYMRGNGKLAVEPRYEKGDKRENYKLEGEVECYNLYSLLKSISNGPGVVDLLVLDIEGGEYKVLEAYPFDKLPIKVVAVEYWLAPEGREKMINLMTSKGYVVEYQSVSDLIFILKSAKRYFST